jgi:hypothetical protein
MVQKVNNRVNSQNKPLLGFLTCLSMNHNNCHKFNKIIPLFRLLENQQINKHEFRPKYGPPPGWTAVTGNAEGLKLTVAIVKVDLHKLRFVRPSG